MRQHAVQREVAIKVRYLPEKRRLKDLIRSLRRILNMDGGFPIWVLQQCTEAQNQMNALKTRERNEVGQAWKCYNELW